MFTNRVFGWGWCAVLALVTMSPAAEPLGDLTGPWVLFVDDFPVETRTGLARTYHPFQKFAGNPVLQATQPWEGVVYIYGTVLPNETHTGYRMWYHSLPPDGGNRLMYAESADGISWTKPNLGIVSWNGSTDNNIFIARNNKEHIPSILHTPWEDAQRQYKLINYNGSLGGFIGAYSPDGIHFTSEPTNPLVTGTGDVGNFIWDYHKSAYVGYVKLNGTVAGQRRRSVGISTSQNWTDWSTPTLILTPDSFDDRWAVGNQKTDFYGLCAFPYESMYIGFVWVLRVTGYVTGCQDGPIFVEVVTSHDGVHWIREEGDRPAILPLGPAGAWDDGMAFTPQHPLVEHGAIKLYYGAIDGSHCGSGWGGGVGLATLRKDGFASLDAGVEGGSVTTRKLAGATGALHVNCTTAADGSVRVEVQDANGDVVPGYAESDCTPLQGDLLDSAVVWGPRTILPAGVSPLRLRFALQNASIYSFRSDNATAVLQPPSIVQQPQVQRAVPGASAQFSVTGEGDAIGYRWQQDGTDLSDDGRHSGTTAAVLTISQVERQDAAAYRCVLSNEGGATVSDSAALRVGTYVFAEVAPSTAASSVAGMSADGAAVCGTSSSRAFIWTAFDGATSLELPADATTTSAASIAVKSDGSVLVAVDSNAGNNLRAKRWDGSSAGGGTFTDLPQVGLRDWTVLGLGTDGSEVWIVGSTVNGGDSNGREACIYRQSLNTTVPIPVPSGGHDHSDLNAVSDNGFAAGQFQYGGSAPTGGARDGFLYTPSQANIAFYTLAGAPSTLYASVCKTISRDGVVQGGWSYKPGAGALVKPVIWKDYLTLVEIPLLTGGDNDDSGEVHALNGDGTIAAGMSFKSPSGAQEAFIWDATHGTRSMAALLIQRGFDTTGWTFTDVTGMCADGTMICGNGTHNGVAKGWAVSFLDDAPQAPRVRTQPAAQSVRPGLSAAFNVEATGEGTLAYRWQFNGVDLADAPHYQGVFTATLTILEAGLADQGSYRCRVMSAYGQAFSQSAELSLVTVRSDFDVDGDVDQADFGFLQACISGPTITQADPACAPALLDADDDVDQVDLALLRACMTAPGVLAELDCD